MFYNKNLISTTELNDYITINFIPPKKTEENTNPLDLQTL